MRKQTMSIEGHKQFLFIFKRQQLLDYPFDFLVGHSEKFQNEGEKNHF
jgi:hypothetical protein